MKTISTLSKPALEKWKNKFASIDLERTVFHSILIISLLALAFAASAQAISSSEDEFLVIDNGQDGLGSNYGHVGMANNGSYVVVYEKKEYSASPHQKDILAGVSTIDGGYQSLGVINTSRSLDQVRPKVAASADASTFAIAWESETEDGSNVYDIYVRRYGSIDGPSYTGTTPVKVNSITTTSLNQMEITMDDNGDFVVAWHNYANNSLYFQRYNSSGVVQGSNVKIDDVYNNSTPNPNIGMDSNGNFVVTWQDSRTEDNSYGVFAKRYNSSGAAQGSTFLVNDITSGYQSGGVIGMAPSGEFIIAYADGTDYYLRKYNSSGVVQGTTAFDPGFTNPRISAVEIDSNLDYVVGYSDNGDDVYVDRYDWSDAIMGGPSTLVNSSTDQTFYIKIDRESTEHLALQVTSQSSSLIRAIHSYRFGLCIGNPEGINGQMEACPGETAVQYTTPNISGAVSYTWTLSDSDIATFNANGQASITTTSTVYVDFDGTNTGDVTLSVVANGGASCGSSPESSETTISNEAIDDPGSISGYSTVVEFSLKQYSVPAIDGAVDYHWTVPTGATIDTDNGNSIFVEFGDTSGDVTVTAEDACGNMTSTSSLTITVQELDETPPEIVWLSPADRSQGVPLSTKTFYIRLDESVSVARAQTISLKSTGKGGITIATMSSTNITLGGKLGYAITFDIAGSLSANVDYYIEIPNTVFRDTQGNFFEGTDATNWTFRGNNPPTNITLSATSILENNSIGAVVATLTGSDSDAGETLSFSLTSGTGDDDNASFSVVGDELLAQEVFDYEVKDSYNILLEVTDNAGTSYEEAFTIAIEDEYDTAPVLMSYSPDDGNDNLAPANITYYLNFDAVVTISGQTSHKFTVYNSGDQVVDIFAGNSPYIEIQESTVVIRSYNILAAEEDFYVTFPTGMFWSEDGTLPVSGLDQGVWTFTTRANDGVGPTLLSRSPEHQSDLEDGNAKTFELVFDEPVNIYGLSTNYGFYRGTDDGYIYNIGSTANLSDDRLTISATEPYSLAANTPYYILLDPIHNERPTIYDDDGNAFGGFEVSSDWTFSTYGPTSWETISPADDETGVALGGTVTLVGNHEVTSSGVSSIVLRDYDTDAIVSSKALLSEVDFDGNTMTVEFGTLEANKHYYIYLGTAIQDQFNQNYPSFTNKDDWDFYTLDNVDPQISSLSPVDDATDVDINTESISITFDEPIQAGNGGLIEIRRVSDDLAHQSALSTAPDFVDIDGNTLTINQFNPFLYESEWYVTIGSGVVEDLSGNGFDGIDDNTTWTFTTENAPPAVQSLSPALESNTSPSYTDFVMTFDKEVVKGSTGYMRIYRKSDNASVYTYTFSNQNIEFDGNTVTFHRYYLALMEPETEYYVYIAPGLIVDASDSENQFAGITDNSTWSFMTRANDGNGPDVVTYAPADGEMDVEISGASVSFDMTFDEPVYLGVTNDNIGLYREEGETDFYFYDIGDPGVIGISEDNLTVSMGIPTHYNMVKGTEYYILFDGLDNQERPIIFDADGNGIQPITDDQAWRFTTYEGLSVQSVSPVDDATNVALDAQFTLTMNNEIAYASGSVYLKYSSNHVNAAVIDASSESVTLNGNQVTIDFGTLDSYTAYYIYIPNNVLFDVHGQSFSLSGSDTWNFTTIDNIPPSIVSLDPADGNTTVATDADLSLTFDKDIDLGAGSITIRNADNGSVVQQLSNFNGSYMTLDGPTVTFDFPSDLPDDTDFYVTISDGYIRTASNSQNTWEGISATDEWTFSTQNPFTAVGSTPDLDATDVLVGQDLTINFNKDAAIGTGSISVYDYNTTELITSLDQDDTDRISVSGTDVTFDLAIDLPFGTVVAVLVDDGFLVSDVDGTNAWSGVSDPDFWNFVTEPDMSAPGLSSVSPNSTSEVAASVNLYITLDEDIQKGSGDFVIKNVANGSVIQTIDVESAAVVITDGEAAINPPIDFPFATEVYIEMASGVLEDVHGNPFAGISGSETWSFVTEYNADNAPEVTALTPAHESMNVSLDPSLSVTFHEPISKQSGDIVIYRASDDQVLETIDVQDEGVVVSDNELSFSPGTLPSDIEVYVTICSTCIGDIEEAVFPGIGANEWSFTTVDVTPPQVVSFEPAHQSEGVAIAIGQMTITFDEDVQKVNPGNFILRELSNDIFVQYYPLIDADEVSISGNIVTIDLPADLAYGTSYYVQLVTPFEDLSGNDYNGFTTADTWTFSTQSEPNEFPTDISIDSNTIDENAGTNQVVGVFATVDADASDTHTYSLVAGSGDDDNGSFSIDDDELVANTSFDYESQSSYFIRIQTMDNKGGTFSKEFTIEVNDLDEEGPVVQTLSPEDGATDVSISTSFVVTYDEDIEAGSGNAIIRDSDLNTIETFTTSDVTFDGNTLTITPTASLDEKETYEIIVMAPFVQDLAGNSHSGIGTNDWLVTIEDATAPQLVTLSPNDDAVGQALDFDLVMTFDEEVQSTGGGTFAMYDYDTDEQIGTDWHFPAGATFDDNMVTYDIPIDLLYETHVYFTISGAIEDAAGNPVSITGKNTWDVTTLDNSTPTDLSLSSNVTDENLSVGTIIGSFTVTDPNDEDEHTLMLVAGEGDEDNASFYIEDQMLWSNEVFDFETKDTYSIRVSVEDNYGNTYEEEFSIAINDVFEDPTNNDPTDISLSTQSIAENEPIGTVIATMSTDDPDGDDTHAYSLVAGEGDDDNGSFTIDDNELMAGEVFDFESRSSYSIRLRTTDNNGGFFEESFTITINDVDERVAQTIVFEAIMDKIYGDADFALDATTSSGLDVTFSVVSGPVTLDGDMVTITGAGEVTISADQAGNDDYFAAEQVTQSFTIAKADQEISLASIEDKLTTDDPFMVTATIDTGLPLTYAVSGPASVVDGAEIALHGVAGTVTVTVSQAGTENYNPAEASVMFDVTEPVVEMQDQAITFSEIADKTFGDADFALDATASSGLDVTFSVVSGPVTLDGNMVTITGAGEVIIAADQAGNSDFNPAEQVTQSFTIAKADQEISITSINNKVTTDDPFDVEASTTSGLTLTYAVTGPATIEGNTLTLDGTAGTVTVTVSQAGDNDYNSSENSVSFDVTAPVIEMQDQTITFASLVDKTFGDAAFDLLATASSELGVTFSVVSGPASIEGNTVTILGAGEVVIAADQAGDEEFNPAPQVTRSFTIVKANQEISFDAIADKTYGDSDFELVASSTSGLDLSYTVISGSVTIDGNMVTITGAGDVVIGASQAGDDNYNAATQVTQGFAIAKADQTITVVAIGDKLTSDDPFEVVASTTSELALAYEVTGPATMDGSMLTLDGTEGIVTVTVSQAGDDNYNSASEQVSFNVVFVLGLVDEVSISWQVFPNPATDWIRIDGIASQGFVQLFDLNGVLALEEQLQSNARLSVHDLKAGMYLMKITEGNNTITTKLMIKR